MVDYITLFALGNFHIVVGLCLMEVLRIRTCYEIDVDLMTLLPQHRYQKVCCS